MICAPIKQKWLCLGVLCVRLNGCVYVGLSAVDASLYGRRARSIVTRMCHASKKRTRKSTKSGNVRKYQPKLFYVGRSARREAQGESIDSIFNHKFQHREQTIRLWTQQIIFNSQWYHLLIECWKTRKNPSLRWTNCKWNCKWKKTKWTYFTFIFREWSALIKIASFRTVVQIVIIMNFIKIATKRKKCHLIIFLVFDVKYGLRFSAFNISLIKYWNRILSHPTSARIFTTNSSGQIKNSTIFVVWFAVSL